MQKKDEEKEKKPLNIRGYAVRKRAFRGNRNTRYVNFAPTEKDITLESIITEAPVTVKAKSTRTGRTITKRFKSRKDAVEHYLRWLKKGNKREVSLESKSKEFDIPLIILEEVYDRGLKSYDSNNNQTPEQFAFARVNSFIHGGEALELDMDLVTEAKMYRITAKTSNKSLGRLSRRKDGIGRQARSELRKRLAKAKVDSFDNKAVASKKLQSVLSGKSQLNPAVAKKLIKTLDINPKSHVAKSLNKVAKTNKQNKVVQKAAKKTVNSDLEELKAKYKNLQDHHDKFVRDIIKQESDSIRQRARASSTPKSNKEVNIAPKVNIASPPKEKKQSFLSKFVSRFKKPKTTDGMSDAEFANVLKKFKSDMDSY